MTKKNIFIRGVDEEIYLKFRSKAVLSKKSLGEALNEAMKLWSLKQNGIVTK